MANARNFPLLKNIQTSSGAYTVSYSICMGVFPREKWPEGKLTTFLQLGPRLRLSGAIILLLLHAFMAQTRKALFILLVPY
jgi:hypothetical protein